MRRKLRAQSDGLPEFHPVLRRVFSARDVHSSQDILRDLKDLHLFSSLMDIDKAVERIFMALKQQQRIMIVGDFDADGATSTALAVKTLQAFGARDVTYLIPNRFAYGYGLSPKIVDVAKQRNPELIITVDNGISSIAGVRRASKYGIDVIITDHHLPGEETPDAYAIVNPNGVGDLFPSKSLAGVGVVFYVMLALRAFLKNTNWFEERGIACPNMSKYLDFVALGTVADVVPLDKNNRILVHQGLRRIRAGQAHPGIMALLKVSGKNPEKLSAADLGFAIGPRLNAAGRLDDMSLGVACLLAPNFDVGLDIAYRLDELNKQRRIIETQMQKEAFDVVDQLSFTENLPYGLCLYDEEWHQGVVGLVASRVKERIHRPVIAFAKTADDTLKGSARSIPGLHIRNLLERVATQNPDLISKFGGHAMAAGLTLCPNQFAEFKQSFANEVKKAVTENQLSAVLETDGELREENLSLEMAQLIYENGPWGQDFPEPSFDGKFKLINQRIVGQRHLKLILQLPDSNYYLDAIAFHVDLEKWPNCNCEYVKIVYRLDINEFQGRRKLQLMIEYLEPA